MEAAFALASFLSVSFVVWMSKTFNGILYALIGILFLFFIKLPKEKSHCAYGY
jgi:hypothetical protein